MVDVIGNRPLKTQIDIVANCRCSDCAFTGVNENMIMFLMLAIKSSGTPSCVGLELHCVRNILNGGVVVCCG